MKNTPSAFYKAARKAEEDSRRALSDARYAKRHNLGEPHVRMAVRSARFYNKMVVTYRSSARHAAHMARFEAKSRKSLAHALWGSEG
jgi:arylamine N-acetyltransferase